MKWNRLSPGSRGCLFFFPFICLVLLCIFACIYSVLSKCYRKQHINRTEKEEEEKTAATKANRTSTQQIIIRQEQCINAILELYQWVEIAEWLGYVFYRPNTFLHYFKVLVTFRMSVNHIVIYLCAHNVYLCTNQQVKKKLF